MVWVEFPFDLLEVFHFNCIQELGVFVRRQAKKHHRGLQESERQRPGLTGAVHHPRHEDFGVDFVFPNQCRSNFDNVIS